MALSLGFHVISLELQNPFSEFDYQGLNIICPKFSKFQMKMLIQKKVESKKNLRSTRMWQNHKMHIVSTFKETVELNPKLKMVIFYSLLFCSKLILVRFCHFHNGKGFRKMVWNINIFDCQGLKIIWPNHWEYWKKMSGTVAYMTNLKKDGYQMILKIH